MSLGINVFRNKCRRKKSRGNICHLGINIAQSNDDGVATFLYNSNNTNASEFC